MLWGGPGADVIRGRGGDDALRGVYGADELSGGAGADDLTGFLGADAIDGGAGDDRLSAGLGLDRVRGGAGADRLDTARDLAGDRVSCDRHDRGVADAGDQVGCRGLQRLPLRGLYPRGAVEPPAFRLSFRCPGAANRCDGFTRVSVRVDGRWRGLGRHRFACEDRCYGYGGTAPIPLPRRARRELARGRRLPLRVVSVLDPGRRAGMLVARERTYLEEE
jgi:hypothetical protein